MRSITTVIVLAVAAAACSSPLDPQEVRIEEAVLLDTGAPADPALWFTIEQLFDQIPLWSTNEGVDDVAVEYDPMLGFPSRIQVGYEEGIFDAGLIYTVTNVGPA